MLDWGRMFIGDLRWGDLLEILLRAVILFGYAIFLFRLWMGKRSISQLSPFEFVIVIALSSAIGDPMINLDTPLINGLFVTTILIGLDKVLVLLTNRYRPVEHVVEGKPTRLIVNGMVDQQGLREASISRDEIFTSLRQDGVEQLGQVKRAYMEMNGALSIFLYPDDQVRPGLSILPPAELEGREDFVVQNRQQAAERVFACSECGQTVETEHPPAAQRCSNCGNDCWEPAILGIEDIDNPARH